jgi:3-phenylpropionate/trans-cinnamate dioxygenase ferredoxin reductase component
MPQHFVIVGAGQAAVQAAATLRQNGFDGAITMIGEESELPYQRPPLSKKYLAGELAAERLHLRPATYYRDHGIGLALGTSVAALEPDAGRIALADGQHMTYDGLVLATGSRARRLGVPGAELDGIHYLRTVADAARIVTALERRDPLVIVGGGYIGLEIAAVAAKRGLDVTVLEAAERVMSRVVSADVSHFYEARHRAAGVRIHCGVAIERIEGDMRVTGVSTLDGRRFDCGTVVAGIGIEPSTALARAAGLECDNGIVVDEFARTAAPRVVAAGDCTNHPSSLYGRRIRLESVHNAIEQAKCAALTLLGHEHAYADVPWFWSDQYALKLQIAGLSQGHEQAVLRGNPSDASFAVFYLRSGRIIAVDAINSPRDFIAGKKLIAARAALGEEVLADTGTDLGEIAAALAQG